MYLTAMFFISFDEALYCSYTDTIGMNGLYIARKASARFSVTAELSVVSANARANSDTYLLILYPFTPATTAPTLTRVSFE